MRTSGQTSGSKIHFTERSIQGLRTSAKRAIYYDLHLTGFRFDIHPNGHRAFGWYRKVRGTPIYRAIGTYPETTVQQARDTAERWNGELKEWKANRFEGENPFAKSKPAQPAARTTTPLFKELVEAYVVGRIREHANKPERAEYDIRWLATRPFAAWRDRPINSITVEDVLSVKNACGAKKALANRCADFVRALFNWSAKAEDGRINFWRVENPAKDVSRYKEKARDRFLQPEELTTFNEALKKETHRDLRDFLMLAINTGARRSDVFGMRWCDVQWEREVWSVPFPKNGESYDVQLLPAALQVLKRRRSEALDSDVFVFPGIGRSGHVVELKKPWDAFRKKAGLPDIRIHDLRRTCASYQAMAGINLPTIAASLGHKSLQSVQVYARLHDESIRSAREAGQAKMVELMASAQKRTKLTARKRQNLLTTAAVSRD